jgi:hypothetical protein
VICIAEWKCIETALRVVEMVCRLTQRHSFQQPPEYREV